MEDKEMYEKEYEMDTSELEEAIDNLKRDFQ
jgi:hypothetical protein